MGVRVEYSIKHADVGCHVYLRDTFSPLPPAQDCPGDAPRVLALEEERFTLAILEAEDLAVRADKELALEEKRKLAWYSDHHAPRLRSVFHCNLPSVQG
jgi:hypothetical protein